MRTSLKKTKWKKKEILKKQKQNLLVILTKNESYFSGHMVCRMFKHSQTAKKKTKETFFPQNYEKPKTTFW